MEAPTINTKDNVTNILNLYNKLIITKHCVFIINTFYT